MAVEVSEPMLCCVTPIAQRTQTPSASAIICATFFNVSMGKPQVFCGKFHREGFKALLVFLQSIYPLVQKRRLGQSIFQNVTADRRKPHEVGSGLGAQEQIGAPRHFVFAQIGDDQLLAAQFVGPFDARCQHRMAFGRVASDNEHQARVLDVLDGTGIAAVTDRAPETHGRRRLAVTRAVVHVVRANHGARQLLHEIAFFIRAFG